MIVVVDTNILFSACLTPAGRIFDLLFNLPSYVELISGHVAIEEMQRHRQKLLNLSKHSKEDLETLIELVLKQIDFFDEQIIDKSFWLEADELTKHVDSNDISFVALALQTGGVLWTGDKKLADHLKSRGFDRVVNTLELSALLENG